MKNLTYLIILFVFSSILFIGLGIYMGYNMKESTLVQKPITTKTERGCEQCFGKGIYIGEFSQSYVHHLFCLEDSFVVLYSAGHPGQVPIRKPLIELTDL